MIASQLSGPCDDISSRLGRHHQNDKRAGETRGRCVKIVVLSSFVDSSFRVRNKMIYVLSWRTVSALTRLSFWCLFPSLLRNSGNKHQNNPLVSVETVRHSNAYIFLYMCYQGEASVNDDEPKLYTRLLILYNTACANSLKSSLRFRIVFGGWQWTLSLVHPFLCWCKYGDWLKIGQAGPKYMKQPESAFQ